jgi:hypothetical protein
MTAKYNSSGDLQWIKILDVFPHDDAQHIVIDHAGNVIVSGDGEGGYTTIKYSSSGDSLWTAILNAYNPFLISIAIDDSNNIYLAGTDDVQSVAVKYNSEGIVKWEKHYSGPNSETRTNNILIDDVGYIYIAGKTLTSTGKGFLLIKYNSNGDTIWTRTYVDTLYDCEVNSITTDASCNIYMTGYSYTTHINYITIKSDSSGDLKWAKTMKPVGSTFGQGKSIFVDKVNNVYVAGDCNRPGSFSDFVITKYNSNGDSIWAAIFNGTANNNDYLYDIVMDSSSNIYVTGGTVDIIGGWNCVTIMYDSSGAQKAIQKFNGNGNGEDEGFAITLDKWNNVLVGGRTTDSVNYYDYLIIKYGLNLVDVKESPKPLPTEYILYQNYPNPFNPTTKIKIEIPCQARNDNSLVTLKVYDVLGKETATLLNEEKPAGEYEINFNATGLTSGVYFYQLKVGSFVETKKMILLR